MKRDEPSPVWPRFDSDEALAELSPEQQREIANWALEAIVASWAAEAHAHSPLARPTKLAHKKVLDHLNSLGKKALADHPGFRSRIPLSKILGPVCRVCGCSYSDPCQEGCDWTAVFAQRDKRDVPPDICLACSATGSGGKVVLFSTRRPRQGGGCEA
jgi:hypothetical protein